MASKIQFKRGTAADLYAVNPVLLRGEPGLEIDTNKIKYGNGVTAWRDLPYGNPALELVDGGEFTAGPVSAVPGAFSPPSINGLTLWLDADNANYVHRTDNRVSLWEDASESDAKFVQSKKASRPTVANQLAAQAVVTFDGDNDAMIGKLDLPEEFTLLVAFRRRGASTNGKLIAAYTANNETELVLCGTETGSAFGVRFAGEYLATQPVDNLVPVVYTLQFSRAGLSTRLNGLNAQPAAGIILPSLTHLSLGGARVNFADDNYSGDIAEVVLYAGVLSSADLLDAENYMMARWGVVQVAHPLLNGMKAFWRLNEEEGTRLDITSAQVPLTQTGTVGFAPGVIESAAEFTGGSNYLQAPSDFNISGSFSIATWFKPAAVSGGVSALVQNWDGGNNAGQVFLGFGAQDATPLIGRLATNEDTYFVSAPDLSANLWHHVALVYDADNNTLTLYHNGAQASQIAVAGTFPVSNIPFRVGINEQAVTPNALAFLADQLGFWDRVLSLQDVQMLYNYELGKEDFTADLYGDNVSLLLHMDKPANATPAGGGSGGVDPYFDNVSLLLHFDGADGSTSTADSSSNNYSLTFEGGAQISTAQSKFGGSSLYIPATGGQVTIPYDPSLEFGDGDFTVECWFYPISLTQNFAFCGGIGCGNTPWVFGFNCEDHAPPATFLGLQLNCFGWAGDPVECSLSVNQWHHVAVARQGSALRYFVNGVLLGEVENSTSFVLNEDGFSINQPQWITDEYGDSMDGYIDELRIVKGLAVYTDNFTPPALPFTVSGTQPAPALLLHFDGSNGATSTADSSSNNYSLTFEGGAQISTAQSKFGGSSLALTKSDNGCVRIGQQSGLDFGTGDFTVEFWFYMTDLSSDSVIFGGANNCGNWSIGLQSTGAYMAVGCNAADLQVTTWPPPQNQWVHFAATRASGTLRFFADGIVIGAQTGITSNYVTQSDFALGLSSSYNFNGYIDELRIVKGTAVYTEAFNPPAAPFQNPIITDSSGAGGSGTITTFIDTSKYHRDVTPAGSAYLNLTDIKYGNASGEFSGGRCEIAMAPEFAFDDGDFTVEFWGKLNYAANSAVFSTAPTAQETGTYLIGFSNDADMFGFCYDINNFTFCAANIAAYYNTWTHYAFVRQDGGLKMYVNGAEVATANTNINLDGGTQTTAVIGRRWTDQDNYYLDGLIDDFRITKGVARYIAEFNPPTKAFPDPIIPTPETPNNGDPYAEYVTLLLHFDGADGSTTFTDNSYLQNTVTANGNAVISTAQSKFGGASLYSAAEGDYLSVPYSTGFSFDGDFTIEAWVNPANSSDRAVCGVYGNGSYPFLLSTVYGDLRVRLWWNNSSNITSQTSLALNQWSHVAVSRQNGVLRLFINGVQEDSATDSAVIESTTDEPLEIGRAAFPGDSVTWLGYIDDLRITKGVARYTANFTPPTVPFPSPFTPGPVSSLLLHFDGTDGSTTFTNAANTAQTLTHEGDVVISTSQSKFGGSSLYQPQSGGSVMVPYSPTMDLGTGDFTIEFWYYPLSLFALGASVIQGGGDPGAPGGDWCNPVPTYCVGINDYGTTFFIAQNCSPPDATATIALTTNTWHHLAVTRQSGTVRFFQDGVLVGTGASNANYLTQQTYGLRICDPLTATQIYGPEYGVSIDGYLDELRIVKGAAVYTANFTPPTAPFRATADVTPTDVTGNDLWLDSTGDISEVNGAIVTWADKSGNGRTATPADYAPAPFVAVGAGPLGQNVVRFSGDPNVLDVSYQFNLKNSSGFVVVGQTVAPADCNESRPERIMSFQPASGLDWQQNDAMVMHHGQNDGGTGTNSVNLYNSGQFALIDAACPLEWAVFSYVIDGAGNVRLRRNGVEEAAAQFAALANKAGAELLIGFGGDFSQGGAFNGDIIEVSIFDHALGEAALIGLERGLLARCLPPPSPTSLLLHFDGSNGSTSTVDSSQNNFAATFNGDAQISTAQSKFGGASLSLPSTGGSVSFAYDSSFDFGSGDFTLEFWLYLNTVSGGGGRVGGLSCDTANPWNVYVYKDAGTIAWGRGCVGDDMTVTSDLVGETWQHIAVTRQNGEVRIFVDGVLKGTQTLTDAYDNSGGVTIGPPPVEYYNYGDTFNGYIDELRITKGLARYTSNFTPPTAPFNQ